MTRLASVIRGIILIFLGIYVISLSAFLSISCFILCFFKNVIELYEYVGMMVFIIAGIIVYISIFRYFMIKKIYNITLLGKKYIKLKTQFTEIEVKRDDILSKSLSYFKTYKIKVLYNSRIRTFFITYKMIDLLY